MMVSGEWTGKKYQESFFTGIACKDGHGVIEDVMRSTVHFEIAALQGDMDAMYYLG